jgi:HEAT repeat protein
MLSIAGPLHTIPLGLSDAKENAMSELVNRLERPTAADIHDLIAALAAANPAERQHAREALVAVGRSAVDPLIRLLDDPHPHVRWQAIKALGAIGDPAAAPALITALEDEEGDVRWLAANGLIDLGHEALQPLLSALAYRASSPDLLEGAHHVLDKLYWRKAPKVVKPVLAALNGPAPQMAVHIAAYAALNALRAGQEEPKANR